ncbi:hypothetical protein OB920_17770 [Halobacteria archaeon HArc-gm2]|nr:hypothetical protein [Halobacteria archaeon HArc-gm2]
MSTEQSPDDVRSSTIVSRSPGLAYERMREGRRTHFAQPLADKLRVEGALLVAMAAALALALGVSGGAAGTASTRLLTLGTAGGALVAAGATVHAAVGTCRLQCEPLTERQALALVTVEDAASYLGIATGGLVVAATVAAALVGLVTGWSPATSTSSVTGAVAAGAMVAAMVVLATGRFFEGRFPRRG